MKKIVTLFAAAAMTVSVAFAQDINAVTEIYNNGAMELEMGNKESALNYFQSAITEAEALKHCIKYKSPSLFYPFIHLTSTSNGKPYCLNIKREVVDSPTEANNFDSFGLSSKSPNCTSAVPAW